MYQKDNPVDEFGLLLEAIKSLNDKVVHLEGNLSKRLRRVHRCATPSRCKIEIIDLEEEENSGNTTTASDTFTEGQTSSETDDYITQQFRLDAGGDFFPQVLIFCLLFWFFRNMSLVLFFCLQHPTFVFICV